MERRKKLGAITRPLLNDAITRPILNDANEFIRSRLCAPRFTRLTQTRLQIQSPDLRLDVLF